MIRMDIGIFVLRDMFVWLGLRRDADDNDIEMMFLVRCVCD